MQFRSGPGRSYRIGNRIEQAKDAWARKRFGLATSGEQGFIPLPA